MGCEHFHILFHLIGLVVSSLKCLSSSVFVPGPAGAGDVKMGKVQSWGRELRGSTGNNPGDSGSGFRVRGPMRH